MLTQANLAAMLCGSARTWTRVDIEHAAPAEEPALS